MPQFSLKRILGSVSLIAVGLGSLVRLVHFTLDSEPSPGGPPPWLRWLLAIVWLAGGSMIGAGLFCPFKLSFVGALVGFFIQLLLLALIIQGLQSLGGG